MAKAVGIDLGTTNSVIATMRGGQDANGILNVTARDRDTGAQQAITITESSNLDRSDVERMVAEARRYHEADARRATAGGSHAGALLQVVRTGYGEGAHQLRPAAVVVSAGRPSDRTPPDRPDSAELGDIDGP